MRSLSLKFGLFIVAMSPQLVMASDMSGLFYFILLLFVPPWAALQLFAFLMTHDMKGYWLNGYVRWLPLPLVCSLGMFFLSFGLLSLVPLITGVVVITFLKLLPIIWK